jgi:hypothetical protein
MTKTLRQLSLLLPLALLGACATTEHWNAESGDRKAGVVKVSFEHDDEVEPLLSETKADQIAENRCKAWGYREAELIPGVVRDCSSEDGNRCELWKVTREYQCQSGATLAHSLAK